MTNVSSPASLASFRLLLSLSGDGPGESRGGGPGLTGASDTALPPQGLLVTYAVTFWRLP